MRGGNVFRTGERGCSSLTAACMFTAAANFHHLRAFGIFAVLAAVFAVLLCRAIAGAVRAFALILFSHNDLLVIWKEKSEGFRGPG